jgi:hypothetical protein
MKQAKERAQTDQLRAHRSSSSGALQRYLIALFRAHLSHPQILLPHHMYLTRRIYRLGELEGNPGIVRCEDDCVAEGCEGLRVEREGGVVR